MAGRGGALGREESGRTASKRLGPLITILPSILSALIDSVSGLTISWELCSRICSFWAHIRDGGSYQRIASG